MAGKKTAKVVSKKLEIKNVPDDGFIGLELFGIKPDQAQMRKILKALGESMNTPYELLSSDSDWIEEVKAREL